MGASNGTARAPDVGVTLWIVIVSLASVALSVAFACATPFAALAAIGALAMARRPALVLVAGAWALNQAVGFGLLHYPVTSDSLGWGLAIAVAALGATLAAQVTARPASPLVASVVALAVSFVAYEAILFAATAILPSGDGAFAPEIVGRILVVNGLAFVALMALHRAALAARWLRPSAGQRLLEV